MNRIACVTSIVGILLGGTACVDNARSQRIALAEALGSTSVANARIGIAEHWLVEQALPEDVAALTAAGHKIATMDSEAGIQSLRVDYGVIRIEFGDGPLNGHHIAYWPCVSEARPYEVLWSCGTGACPAGFSTADGTARARDATSLSPEVMPMQCR